jgi:hypothetical protein
MQAAKSSLIILKVGVFILVLSSFMQLHKRVLTGIALFELGHQK